MDVDPWQVLATLVRERRLDLGMSQDEAAALAGVSGTTWRSLEVHGRPVRELSRAGIAKALRWSADSIDQTLAGGEPTLVTTESALSETRAEDRMPAGLYRQLWVYIGRLEDRIGRLEGALDELGFAVEEIAGDLEHVAGDLPEPLATKTYRHNRVQIPKQIADAARTVEQVSQFILAGDDIEDDDFGVAADTVGGVAATDEGKAAVRKIARKAGARPRKRP